jgi:predicted ATPase/class 3 adenylate cyclase
LTKARPSGTVTFLFTDIEGSTALWERQPEAMRESLERHDRLLRGIFEADRGYVFKTVGDAFCVAFESPTDAVRAALEAQTELGSQDWGETPLRVRMGIHSGEAVTRDDDYFGPSPNRTARLMAVAHGGQVLLSSATEQLLGGQLPEGAQLADLGMHRLKDLLQPEHVWQLHRPGLAASFQPLRSLDARLTNLPLQLTPFIGREKDVAEVRDLLGQEDVRLLTLTGPGGTGKTRLSLQVAAELVERFPDGVWFVPLASVTDPGRVPSEIAETLDIRDSPHEALVKTLLRRLQDQRLLLVLDNFEQVVEAAYVLGELLAGTPGLKVLVTSRERLKLYGERVHPVTPLALPNLSLPQSPADLSRCDAVGLFIQRARAARPGFAIDESNAVAVAGICIRLDGLPLAIELAAARIALFSPAELLSRLGERLKTVASGLRDLPERQRTLRGAIDWSYELLASGEKQLFGRLAVFQGGRTYEAAEAVCAQGLGLDILDGLQSLVDKSLLEARPDATGKTRLMMLETIHEYAQERLAESGEGEAIHRAQARYFLELAESSGAGNKFLQRDLAWMQVEEANYLSAIEWSFSRGEGDLGSRLVLVMCDAWDLENRASLMLEWSERALSADVPVPDPIRGRLLHEEARALSTMGRMDESRALTLRALVLFEELGDDRWTIKTLLQAARTTFRTPSLFGQGREWQDAALEIAGRIPDPHIRTFIHLNRGELFRDNGELEKAEAAYEEALGLARGSGMRRVEMMLLGNLSLVCASKGDYSQALRHGLASLVFASEASSPGYTAEMLGIVASALGGLGQSEKAAKLFGASASILDRHAISIQAQDLPEYERGLCLAKSGLAPERFEVLWTEGAAMSADEAVVYAASADVDRN